jgi:hypothetical protein
MADPNWIKKTVACSILLAVPSLILLVQIRRDRARQAGTAVQTNLAFWTGAISLATFVCWFVNVMFEWSVMFMIGWPLFGIALSVLGCALAFLTKGGERIKLLGANFLLLILSLMSIIAPN